MGWAKQSVRHWAIPVLLFGLVMGVYGNSLRNGYHYDDFQTISENVWIRSFSNSLMYFTSGTPEGRDSGAVGYRPVLLLSYALNYAASGSDPWGYHLFQVIVHAGSALLVYWLVWQLHKNQKIAVLAAILFGLHPANTEAVNYLTARSSLLSSFFSLLAFCSYVNYRCEEGSDASRRMLAYIGTVVGFTLAILTDESSIILPLLLVAYDFYFIPVGQHRPYRRLVIGYAPIIFVGGFYIVIRHYLAGIGAAAATYYSDPVLSVLTALKMFARFLLLFIWPINLSADHLMSRSLSVLGGETLLSTAVIGSLMMGIWLLYRRAPWLSFCGVWFLITLMPIGLRPFITDAALFQENWGYLSSAGFAMAMSWGLFNLPARGIVIWLRNGFVIALCTWYGMSVVSRNMVWKDEVTLLTDALQKNPGSIVANLNIGAYYYRQGKWDLAAQAYSEVLRLAPENAKALSNLGMLYYSQGRLHEAEEIFRRALKVNPLDPMIHGSFGLFLSQIGRFDEAIKEYKEAVSLSPMNWRTMLNLGWTYAAQNQWNMALDSFQMALKVNTFSPDVYTSMGTAFRALGQIEKAQQSFEQALSNDHSLTSAYEQLNELYIQQGKIPEAIQLMERLLDLDPQNAQAHHVLGYLSEQQGNYDSALQHYRDAIRFEPKRYGSYFNLGNIYWRFGETDLALRVYEKALELEPNFVDARFNMGKLLDNLGRRQEAIEQYRLVIDRARALGNQSMEINAKQSLEKLAAELKTGNVQTKILPPVVD